MKTLKELIWPARASLKPAGLSQRRLQSKAIYDERSGENSLERLARAI